MPEPTHVCALCGIQLYKGTVMAQPGTVYWFDLEGHGRCRTPTDLGVFHKHLPADPPPIGRDQLEEWLDD